MRRLIIVVLVLVAVLLVAFVSSKMLITSLNQVTGGQASIFHFGVSFCGNTSDQAKMLVDRVKNFTNLLVVQSGPVSTNESAMNEIVNYAVASGLDVIVYFGYFNPQYPWQIPWLDYAKQQWGSHFLGVYLHDEVAGEVIDANWVGNLTQFKISNNYVYQSHAAGIDMELNGSLPIDNTGAAYHFNLHVKNDLGLSQLQNRSIPAFTSDYALYWFDYLGGYDVIFAELGSNQSTTQIIDLARGAARLQDKQWGTIITWSYDQPPYITNSTQLYSELMTTYIAGAQYATIFNYPQIDDNPYGILTDAHFVAMQQFWNAIQTQKPNNPAEAALVLPQDYGWGMRYPQDTIWGLWRPDATSAQIWSISQKLQAQYGLNLDIVYDDPAFTVQGRGYQHIYFWNQTL